MRTIKAAALLMITSLVVYLVLFAILCTVPLGGVKAVMRTNDYYLSRADTNWLRHQQHDPERWYDVRVLGSSHAYRGYDPRVFATHGTTLYNLGSKSQSLMNSRILLDTYIDTMNTGLVILDLYDVVLRMEGLESATELIVQVPSDKAAWRMAWAQQDLRAINMLALRHFGDNTPDPVPGPGAILLGYVERNDSLAPDRPPGRVVADPFQHRQVQALEGLLNDAQERNQPIVLVSHPMPSSADRGPHEELRSLVGKFLAQHPGIRYIDLSFKHGLDDRDHFYDDDHLNQAGVDLFNRQLIDSLHTLGLLPVHRPRQ